MRPALLLPLAVLLLVAPAVADPPRAGYDGPLLGDDLACALVIAEWAPLDDATCEATGWVVGGDVIDLMSTQWSRVEVFDDEGRDLLNVMCAGGCAAFPAEPYTGEATLRLTILKGVPGDTAVATFRDASRGLP